MTPEEEAKLRRVSRGEAYSIASRLEGDIHPIHGAAHCLAVLAERVQDHDSETYEALYFVASALHQRADALLEHHARLFHGLYGDEPEPAKTA